MEVALVLARLLLASVFAVAGAAKLADLAGSRVAVAGFGVPERLASPLGTLLPFAELTIAGLLLFSSTARAGALAGFVLLALFAIAICVAMGRGRAPECHCFGQLHSEPAGAKMLVRNLVLASVAGFVAFGNEAEGPGVSQAVAELDGVEWVGVAGALLVLAVLAGGAAAMVGLLRQNGRLLLRLEGVEGALRAHGIDVPEVGTPGPPSGLPVGEPAPDFSLPGLHGETVTLGALRAGGKPVVLVFTDPNCIPCRQLMPHIGEWQRSLAGDLIVAAISRGASEELRAEASEHGLQVLLVDEGDQVSEAYRARLTPGAVLIDDEGRIATPVAAGNEAIASLVEQAGAPALEVVPGGVPALAEGDELPETALRSLDGDALTLADAVGDRERTILFWDPGCGFCQRMLADLRSLEDRRPEVTRSLLLISQGTPEANREHGLGSEIVIEQDAFALAGAVGVPGTPAALSVDGAGRIASSVALGADAVLDLLGQAATRT
jgi:methylamine dehydrogenase accessory protein MauD